MHHQLVLTMIGYTGTHFEVDFAALAVGEAAFVEELEEDVRDVSVCFFDLPHNHSDSRLPTG